MSPDLRDRAAAAWWALRCALGFHAKPIGLIDWDAPYKPGEDVLRYRQFRGCPRCRREFRQP